MRFWGLINYEEKKNDSRIEGKKMKKIHSNALSKSHAIGIYFKRVDIREKNCNVTCAEKKTIHFEHPVSGLICVIVRLFS